MMKEKKEDITMEEAVVKVETVVEAVAVAATAEVIAEAMAEEISLQELKFLELHLDQSYISTPTISDWP